MKHAVVALGCISGLEVVKMPAEAKSAAVEALKLRRHRIQVELVQVEREITTVKQAIARLEHQIDNLSKSQRQAA